MCQVLQLQEVAQLLDAEQPPGPALLQELLRRDIYELGVHDGRVRRHCDARGHQTARGGGEEEAREGGAGKA